FSLLPYSGLSARYLFWRGPGVRRNELSFGADTRLQGKQRLSGQWAFQRAGTLRWSGQLLGKPLNLAGQIDARNWLTATGQALGGPLRLGYGLRDRSVDLALSPDFSGVRGDLTARGTLNNLERGLTRGRAGPVALSGQGRYDASGLRADLGPLQLSLDRRLRGSWSANGLSVSGTALSGSGRLDLPASTLSGRLEASVPLLEGAAPSGPLLLNWRQRRGNWSFAGGQLGWRDQTFTLTSAGLRAAGFELRGALSLDTGRQVSGRMTARSASGTVEARGLGDRLALVARQGGVTVKAVTRLTPGFPTTARVQGADISGDVSMRDGLRFILATAGQRTQGIIRGQNWDVSGGVDLAALRPVLGASGRTLSGTATLNLHGLSGTAHVRSNLQGATLDGTLTRQGGALSADLSLAARGAVARLAGQVSPGLDPSGPVTFQGQTVTARVSGPYHAPRLALSGQTKPLSLAGLTLPGQLLNVSGPLTPSPSLSGRFGKLQLAYRAGQVSVRGPQKLSGLGQQGEIQLDGTWAPGFVGR
ncbi:MAG: translocation/assembly module TamB domain-containing protein, partial [Deinococcus sp.]